MPNSAVGDCGLDARSLSVWDVMTGVQWICSLMASCAASTEGRVRRGGLDHAPAILNHTAADNRAVDLATLRVAVIDEQNSAYDKPRVLYINRIYNSVSGQDIKYSTHYVEV